MGFTLTYCEFSISRACFTLNCQLIFMACLLRGVAQVKTAPAARLLL